MIYQIEIKSSAHRELQRLPVSVQGRIVEHIDLLAMDPRPSGCKKLTGSTAYRIRVGAYRIVYDIQDNILLVLIVRIAHRSEVYR